MTLQKLVTSINSRGCCAVEGLAPPVALQPAPAHYSSAHRGGGHSIPGPTSTKHGLKLPISNPQINPCSSWRRKKKRASRHIACGTTPRTDSAITILARRILSIGPWPPASQILATMSSSLKSLCLRIPAAPASLVRCGPKASFSPLAQSPLCAQPRVSLSATTFSRANHSLAGSSPLRPSIASLVAKTRSSPTSSSSSSSALRLRLQPYSSAASAPADTSAPALDWDSFFKLRLRRRRIQLLFSVATGLLGGAVGTVVLAEGFAEPLVAQVPLDPFFTLGIMTMACAGMGWLVGPTLGNQVFYIINRRFKTQMLQKEGEFFARVKRHRADPTNSSAGNPGMRMQDKMIPS